MNVQDALNRLVEKITTWFQDFVVLLPNLVIAAITVIGFALAARVIRRIIESALGKVSPHRNINRLLATVGFIALVTMGIFIALGIIGLEKTVTSLLAGVGILGLALGFAFQDIASNFMSGIILLMRRPFAHDDIIETNDQFGTVMEVNLRSTVLRSFDGKVVFLPNSAVLNSALVNHSANGSLRVDIPVGVAYGDDLERARSVALDAVAGVPGRDDGRDVELFYESFGDSSINFTVRFWIPFQKRPDYLQARSDAIVRIKKAFDENAITIPFPIRTLDFGVVGGEKLSDVLATVAEARRNV